MRQLRFSLTTLLALALLAGAGLAEEVIVIPPSSALEPGTRLDGDSPIELAEGEILTLMTRSGKVRREGPFSGPPAPAGGADAKPRLFDAVSKLFEPEPQSQTTGVFRAGPGGPVPENPWWIDPDTSGDHCLSEDSPRVLWRAVTDEEEGLEIRGAGGTSEVWWEEDEPTVDWPGDLELEEGASYSFTRERSPTGRRITFHLLPAGDADLATQLERLVDLGCRRQAWLLLATLD